MAKIKVPELSSSTFKGWAFVIFAGAVLTVLAIIDHGGFPGGATGITGCVMTVNAEQVNVRSSPGTELAPVETLKKGQEVDAQRVVTNGFRQLAGENRWALDASLTTNPGSSC